MASRLRNLIRRYGVKHRILTALSAPGRGAQSLRRRAVARAGAWAWTVPPERLGQIRPLLRLARRLASRRLAPAQVEALVIARTEGWEAAAPRFRAIAAGGLRGAPARGLLAPPTEQPAARLLAPDPARPAYLPRETAARIVLYTTAIGQRPQLPPLYGIPEGMRCICFTDADVAAPGWEICAPVQGGEAYHRIRADAVLAEVAPEATHSLYLAPDRLRVGNLDTLIGRWLMGSDIAMWRHERTDWQAMAEEALIAPQNFPAPDAETVLAQALACEKAGLMRGAGAFDTGVIWRRHGEAAVIALMGEWQDLHAATPGNPDISLYRALHGTTSSETRPAIPPATLGSGADNPYFARYRRRPTAPRLHLAPGVGESFASRRPHAGRQLPVVFLYSKAGANAGGTFIRGRQLSQLIAAHCDDFEVEFTSDVDEVRNSVVILTLRALWEHSSDQLAALAQRNIAVIGDWLDGTVDPTKARLLDAHMAMCFRQALDLKRLYPDTPAFHVTHHVNADIPARTAPEARLHTGYFGALFNTTRPKSMAEFVDLVPVVSLDPTWIERLADYNCHWIVRVDPGIRSFAGWKPFLKGFVAARSGAVVITTRDDPNAVHYLGDDYPFLADSLAVADLEAAWARMAGAFGGPDWRLAQDIMRQVAARSSDEQVAAEFAVMIDEILG